MPRLKLATRRYLVSDSVFETLTEAVRLRSNRIRKFASLRTTVEHAIDQLMDYDFDDMHFHDFISSGPIKGGNTIHVSLRTCSNERLSQLQEKLQQICGIEVYDRTAIAYFAQLCIDEKLY